MIDEELKKLLMASDGDNYFFDRETTFVKDQTITVQAGGNFFNGSQPSGNKPVGTGKIRRLTDTELQQLINQIMPKIRVNRNWFCVIKVLMLHGQMLEGDFNAARDRILEIFPAGVPHMFDAEDIQRLNTGSMRGPVSTWILADSPFKRNSEFTQYKNLAMDFEQMYVTFTE